MYLINFNAIYISNRNKQKRLHKKLVQNKHGCIDVITTDYVIAMFEQISNISFRLCAQKELQWNLAFLRQKIQILFRKFGTYFNKKLFVFCF